MINDFPGFIFSARELSVGEAWALATLQQAPREGNFPLCYECAVEFLSSRSVDPEVDYWELPLSLLQPLLEKAVAAAASPRVVA